MHMCVYVVCAYACDVCTCMWALEQASCVRLAPTACSHCPTYMYIRHMHTCTYAGVHPLPHSKRRATARCTPHAVSRRWRRRCDGTCGSQWAAGWICSFIASRDDGISFQPHLSLCVRLLHRPTAPPPLTLPSVDFLGPPARHLSMHPCILTGAPLPSLLSRLQGWAAYGDRLRQPR